MAMERDRLKLLIQYNSYLVAYRQQQIKKNNLITNERRKKKRKENI